MITGRFVIILLLLFIWSCKQNIGPDERIEVERLLGKEISLPVEQELYIGGVKVDAAPNDVDYKIITYIDSTECTQCKMKLIAWTEIINAIQAIPEVDTDFLMIINSPDTTGILDIIMQENFNGSVVFDNGQFKKLNTLPDNPKYHTFLLNGRNEILAIGNPSENPKIKKLFMQEIAKTIDSTDKISDSGPEGLCTRPVVPIGLIAKGDTVQKSFTLVNLSDLPYTIEALVPSCSCVKAIAVSDTIYPHNNSTVNMTFVGDSVSRPFRYHIEVYLAEYDKPYLLTAYGHTH